MSQAIILWYRSDFRLRDHAALYAAAALGPILPVFIWDEDATSSRQLGAASRWWLHHSLDALHQDLVSRGGQLVRRRGDTVSHLSEIADNAKAAALYFSRCYEPWARKLEKKVQSTLNDRLQIKRFTGTLLHEPEKILSQSGTPYKVFTPFWRKLKDEISDQPPLPIPRAIDWYGRKLKSEDHQNWRLLPSKPDWAAGLRASWQAGEGGGKRRLKAFVKSVAQDYQISHDRPDHEGTSRLSPHLHFGELSPSQVWHQVKQATVEGALNRPAAESYLRELGWREFCHHLLFHFPKLAEENFRPQFDNFPWRTAPAALKRWQHGQTGYPLVDAGMRELWHCGWMHNRVRMVVASFLIKHLRIHWREGEAWFWDTLVDANLANNAANWQWVAGSGADAAPYFRIFNPITQGEKFDPHGHYIRRWVPELAPLPDRYLNRPWEAPAKLLNQTSIRLGDDYPQPLVEHKQAREAALAAYAKTKG